MPLDDAGKTDFGHGRGREQTTVEALAQAFASKWQAASQSDSEDDLEIGYRAWEDLQNEPSVCAQDAFAKLGAFRFRYDQMPITHDMLCEGDVEFIDTLVTEALATLRVLNGMAE